MKIAEAKVHAERILYFYKNAGNKSIAKTCAHFQAQGLNRSVVWRILKRCIERNSSEVKRRGGHNARAQSDQFLTSVNEVFRTNPNISVRSAAKQLGVPKSTLSDAKVRKLGIRAYTRKDAPKYTDGQRERAQVACGVLANKTWAHAIIMDDETYVHSDPSQVPGRSFYHARNKSDVPIENRLKPRKKFPKKFLVWQCVDGDGHVSKPFVSTKSMDQHVYLECLEKYLLPFIREYHNNQRMLFWPDLARCHYANAVRNWLNERRIPYVEEEENAPNVPQARPIERFWSLCKTAYRARPEGEVSKHAFTCIWARLSKQIASRHLKKLMKKTRPALRQIRDHGVYGPYME